MQTSSDGPAAKRQRIGPPTAEVRYADAESAVRALLELSGSEFDDNMLVVSPVESNDKAVLVEGLPAQGDWAKFRAHFATVGRVVALALSGVGGTSAPGPGAGRQAPGRPPVAKSRPPSAGLRPSPKGGMAAPTRPGTGVGVGLGMRMAAMRPGMGTKGGMGGMRPALASGARPGGAVGQQRSGGCMARQGGCMAQHHGGCMPGQFQGGCMAGQQRPGFMMGQGGCMAGMQRRGGFMMGQQHQGGFIMGHGGCMAGQLQGGCMAGPFHGGCMAGQHQGGCMAQQRQGGCMATQRPGIISHMVGQRPVMAAAQRSATQPRAAGGKLAFSSGALVPTTAQVTFAVPLSAAKAVKQLSGQVLHGKKMSVALDRNAADQCTVLVTNLSPATTQMEIMTRFAALAPVVSCAMRSVAGTAPAGAQKRPAPGAGSAQRPPGGLRAGLRPGGFARSMFMQAQARAMAGAAMQPQPGGCGPRGPMLQQGKGGVRPILQRPAAPKAAAGIRPPRPSRQLRPRSQLPFPSEIPSAPPGAIPGAPPRTAKERVVQIEFEGQDATDAVRVAVDAFDGQEMEGNTLQVLRGPGSVPRSVLVKNFPDDVNVDDISEMFAGIGTVKSVTVK